MKYKHSCVVDVNGAYIDLVLVFLEPGEDGQIQENIQYYALKEGETLVDTRKPTLRPYAGAAGFIRPRWNGEAWEEAAVQEEIAAWELEHPAPEPAPNTPTVETRLADLEDAYTAMMFGGDLV